MVKIDVEKCAKVTHDVMENFAGVCNTIMSETKKKDPSFDDVTSSILAGSVQFCVKSLIVAGFSREEILETVVNCYDTVSGDEDMVRVKLLRSLMSSMGDVKIQ